MNTIMTLMEERKKRGTPRRRSLEIIFVFFYAIICDTNFRTCCRRTGVVAYVATLLISLRRDVKIIQVRAQLKEGRLLWQ